MYSDDAQGTVRALSEFVQTDHDQPARLIHTAAQSISRPLFVGALATANSPPGLGRVASRKTPRVHLIVRDPSSGAVISSGGRVASEDTGVPAHTTTPGTTPVTVPLIDSEVALSVDQEVSSATDKEWPAIHTPEEELEAVATPQLVPLIALGNPGLDLPSGIQGKYGMDPFFKLILDNPSHYKNFECRDGLVYLKDLERRILCIPDVLIGSRRAREIVISHAHSILAHLGAKKTLYYLKDNVWWKDMVA
ncbi:hypothetical protein OBBRIDRAFT_875163, partial [Obba rivulosa]